MAPGCDISIVDSSAGELRVIRQTMMHNYMVIAAALALTVAAIIGVIFMVSYMIQTVQSYYRYMAVPEQNKTSEDTDDYYYDDKQQDRDPRHTEYSNIQSRIAYIKAMYGAYNREMGTHARNVLNREPDDLMDESIIDRKKDEYDY